MFESILAANLKTANPDFSKLKTSIPNRLEQVIASSEIDGYICSIHGQYTMTYNLDNRTNTLYCYDTRNQTKKIIILTDSVDAARLAKSIEQGYQEITFSNESGTLKYVLKMTADEKGYDIFELKIT